MAGQVLFQSPWIRFAPFTVMEVGREQDVSIPVDKVRAKPLSSVKRSRKQVSIPVDKVRAYLREYHIMRGREYCFNPRG